MDRRALLAVLLFGLVYVWGCPGNVQGAYSAHQNDQDINNFLILYPSAQSTKLDDCALCHRSGKIGSKTYGSCDYCHQTYKTQEPHGDILQTLNSYGLAYKAVGIWSIGRNW
jgi:hypothetical protein